MKYVLSFLLLCIPGISSAQQLCGPPYTQKTVIRPPVVYSSDSGNYPFVLFQFVTPAVPVNGISQADIERLIDVRVKAALGQQVPPAAVQPEEPQKQATPSLSAEQVLIRSCTDCHTRPKISGDFAIFDDTGKLTPDLSWSAVDRMVSKDRMPKEGQKLSAAEKELIHQRASKQKEESK